MKKKIILLLLLFIYFAQISLYAQEGIKKYTCTLITTYKLALYGTSNTVDFTCNYEGNKSKQPLKFGIVNSRNVDQPPTFKLKVEQLDCGGAGINYDMKKTLESDIYPYIRIKPVKTFFSFEPAIGSGRTGEIQAWITIAGTEKLEKVQAKVQYKGDNIYRISGKHRLYFSHYHMEAPKAMFGMIKVADGIDLEFDMEIRVQNQ
jgi:hypothetical protein